MTSPLEEAVERLRDNALFIPGWTPPTDFRVSVRLDDLRTILNALSLDEERCQQCGKKGGGHHSNCIIRDAVCDDCGNRR